MLKKKYAVCYSTYAGMNHVTAVQMRSCRVSRSNCQSVGTQLQFADSYPT